MLNQPIVILGLGETGLSCARFLFRSKIPFSVVDSRENPPQLSHFKAEFPDIPVYTGGFPKAVLGECRTLLLSPGIAKDNPLLLQSISKNCEIIGDIELLARLTTLAIVGITGSNGKSTVTRLVGEMVKQAGLKVGIGGNLGPPALDLLEANPEILVLELSSFQLETTYSLKPFVSTILNISADHLDRHKTLDNYVNAKLRIYNQAKHIVFNREETSLVSRLPPGIPSISFGLSTPQNGEYGIIHAKGESWLAKGNMALLKSTDLKLLGQHNLMNALSALAIGETLNLSKEVMIETLKSFQGLPHRCEWVRTLREVVWVNDSKGTNVGATLAALWGLGRSIAGKWILIAGGIGKNADFSPLIEPLSQYCRSVILLGEAKKELHDTFKAHIPCVFVNSMEEAVLEANILAHPEDGVLLSPACSSLDMFRNFEERGEVFKACVQHL